MQASSVADPRPFRSVLAAAVLLVLALLAVAGVRTYRDLAAARRHETELEESIRQVQGEIDVLTRRVEDLRDDPEALERLAREDLWMARPGDVVIVLPPEEAPPPAAARTPQAPPLDR